MMGMETEIDEDGYLTASGVTKLGALTLFDERDRQIMRAAGDQYVAVLTSLLATGTLGGADIEAMSDDEYGDAISQIATLLFVNQARIVDTVLAETGASLEATIPTPGGHVTIKFVSGDFESDDDDEQD